MVFLSFDNMLPKQQVKRRGEEREEKGKGWEEEGRGGNEREGERRGGNGGNGRGGKGREETTAVSMKPHSNSFSV